MIEYIMLLVVGLAVGFGIGLMIKGKSAAGKIKDAETEAARIISNAEREAETKRKEAVLESKDKFYQARAEFEKETRDKRQELQNQERRLTQKEESLDKKVDLIDKREADATRRERELVAKEKVAQEKEERFEKGIREQRQMLEKIANMTAEEAKRQLMVAMEDEAKEEADKKSKNIMSLAIQRYASDYVAEATVSVVNLPNDEMKGRIIGREGRNIRALEAATGIDLIIDDTPEAVILSCYDPLRREIAKLTIERLIHDGRIHPARIEEIAEKVKKDLENAKPDKVSALSKKLETLLRQYDDRSVDAKYYGYEDKTLPGGYQCSALEELLRWRLWKRTGGGLMAELGSHQLDASGIFISGLRKDGQKALPLTVSAVGGRHIFPYDRECEDHVYCIYEFPGPEYESDPNKKIGVTYSSINGNGFGGYGETVLGTKGTLILEREQEVMLYPTASASTKVTVKKDKDDKVALDTTQSGGGEAAALGKKALESGPPSRGYTEEIEHWAWCIRNPAPENLPRCHPKVALGDAVIALVTNIAIRENKRIEFQPGWFDPESDETPEGQKPDVGRYA